MPKLNRRRFLQAASAAGLAPAIPALPVSAAAAPASATTAQMMWASLFARAGNVPDFVSLTRTMGLSRNAARGVYAKLVETQVLTAHGAQTLARVTRPAPAASSSEAMSSSSRKMDFRDLFRNDEPDEPVEVEIENDLVEPEELADEDPAGV